MRDMLLMFIEVKLWNNNTYNKKCLPFFWYVYIKIWRAIYKQTYYVQFCLSNNVYRTFSVYVHLIKWSYVYWLSIYLMIMLMFRTFIFLLIVKKNFAKKLCTEAAKKIIHDWTKRKVSSFITEHIYSKGKIIQIFHQWVGLWMQNISFAMGFSVS